jgi:hypothetical protein
VTNNEKTFTSGAAGPSTEFLNEQARMAVEDPEPVLIAEQLLEERRFQLVLRMTAQRFAKLSRAEKRNYVRWADHFERVFAEKHSLFKRNTPADIELPTFLQARG